MLRKLRTLKTGLLATALTAGILFLVPGMSSAAERAHQADHDRGRAVQHFDRGKQADRGHMRVDRDWDRGFEHSRAGFAGRIAIEPVPEYVPVPDYGYYVAAPAPGYAVPMPDYNAVPYGY